MNAATAFAELGATMWSVRAEGELALTGQRGRSEPQLSPWAKLSAGEIRVAEVIIDGATNTEAVTALFISPRTVETHLRQIYRKLGVRSRSELTRLLALAGAPGSGAVDWSTPARVESKSRQRYYGHRSVSTR